MTHKLKTETFSQKIEHSGGVILLHLTPLFSFVTFHLNVKIINIRTRRFRENVLDVYFRNLINKVTCTFKKIQANLVSNTDTATKTGPTLKKKHSSPNLGVDVWSKALIRTKSDAAIKYGYAYYQQASQR